LRAVLDPSVIISGLLSPAGNPARLLSAWERGEFELTVSPALLEELERALAYPRLRRHVSEEDAERVLQWLAESARVVSDPASAPPVHSADPGDDYVIALAESRQAILVSGDKHLLDLADRIPVLAPADFVKHLAERPDPPE
jgi:putative PIN family toxin of toxin-antitoxin system